MAETVLYDYWRSSASYRLRIAFGLLGEPYRSIPIDLLAGAQRSPEHISRNPQGQVPVVELDGRRFHQSLAIIEYLEETRRFGFLPDDAVDRQRVRALSYAIAMEIHPVCNLSVTAHVMALTDKGDEARAAWNRKFIGEGLLAFERMLDDRRTGTFCHGDHPTMADICLVPQLYNAARWGIDLTDLPRIRAISLNCDALPAFAAAHPDRCKPS